MNVLTNPNRGRRSVIRISLPWMMGVMSAIDQLGSIAANDLISKHWYSLFNAKSQIETLFTQSIYSSYLRISREKANVLHSLLEAMLNAHNSDHNKVISESDLWNLNYERNQFKTVFLSELSTLPSFLVVAKESYDVNLLIDEGTKLFPASLLKKAPEAVPDAMETGKALAFELGTACGFHVFRVTEAVLKRYWDDVSSGAKHPNLQTIGSYAAEMEKKNYGDKKVIESLKQLARLHRNPLIHPEVILNVDEAIETLGIARSVIGAMLRVLPDVPPTTTSILAGP